MKGFYGILLMLLLIITGIFLLYLFWGSLKGNIALIVIEVAIGAAIILLLIRYFRSRRQR